MSHLQNCSLKIYLKSTGEGSVGRGQDGCERRIKFFCENSKKNWGGGRVGFGGQGRCGQRSEVFVKIQKQIVGGGGSGWGVGVTGWM